MCAVVQPPGHPSPAAGCWQASIKELGRSHPTIPVWVPLSLRYCIFVVFAIPVATRCTAAGLRAACRTKAPWLQLGRSILNVAEVGLIYVAVPHLPLADANAVMALMNIMVRHPPPSRPAASIEE